LLQACAASVGKALSLAQGDNPAAGRGRQNDKGTAQKGYDYAMSLADFKRRVLAATVRLTKVDGQGVLVPGGYILTAAHCIKWSGTGGMVLGDDYLEPVKTRDGRKFRAQVVVAEPVADVAVLGPAYSQERSEDCEAFEAFAEAVKGVPLYAGTLRGGASIPVQIFTPEKKWIIAKITRYGVPGGLPGGSLSLKADAKIEGGCSGGPVVSRTGLLIGIVSNGSYYGGSYHGSVPVPWLALPRWVGNIIREASQASRDACTGTRRDSLGGRRQK
jgi:S1-C subfamily serine protease